MSTTYIIQSSCRWFTVKIYILAQGRGSRWKEELGRNLTIDLPSEYKQLIPIGDGEVLINRTNRQIWQSYSNNPIVGQSVSDVTVIAPSDFVQYMPSWVKFRSFHEPTGCILEGICRTKKEWEGHRVVFLLGDVVYSNRMIREIFSNTDTVSFFGREGANVFTGKEASEIFAFSFNEDIITQLNIWNEMRFLWFTKQIKAKLWHLRDDMPSISFAFRKVFDDYTDDIDSPEEYNLFYEKLKESALADDER